MDSPQISEERRRRVQSISLSLRNCSSLRPSHVSDYLDVLLPVAATVGALRGRGPRNLTLACTAFQACAACLRAISDAERMNRGDQGADVLHLRVFETALAVLESICCVPARGYRIPEDHTMAKLLYAVLRGIASSLSPGVKYGMSSLGRLLHALNKLFVYGCHSAGAAPEVPVRGSAEFALPSRSMPPSSSNAGSTGKAPYRPPHRRGAGSSSQREKTPNPPGTSHSMETGLLTPPQPASDSDVSDSDSCSDAGLWDRDRLTRVRILALQLIPSVARVDPKSLHAHWELLLPSQVGGDPLEPHPYVPSLLTPLLHDPDVRTRCAAAAALAATLDRPAKKYLMIAQWKNATIQKGSSVAGSSHGSSSTITSGISVRGSSHGTSGSNGSGSGNNIIGSSSNSSGGSNSGAPSGPASASISKPGRDPVQSFTTLSHRLGWACVQLHRGLLAVVEQQQQPQLAGSQQQQQQLQQQLAFCAGDHANPGLNPSSRFHSGSGPFAAAVPGAFPGGADPGPALAGTFHALAVLLGACPYDRLSADLLPCVLRAVAAWLYAHPHHGGGHAGGHTAPLGMLVGNVAVHGHGDGDVFGQQSRRMSDATDASIDDGNKNGWDAEQHNSHSGGSANAGHELAACRVAAVMCVTAAVDALPRGTMAQVLPLLAPVTLATSPHPVHVPPSARPAHAAPSSRAKQETPLVMPSSSPATRGGTPGGTPVLLSEGCVAEARTTESAGAQAGPRPDGLAAEARAPDSPGADARTSDGPGTAEARAARSPCEGVPPPGRSNHLIPFLLNLASTPSEPLLLRLESLLALKAVAAASAGLGALPLSSLGTGDKNDAGKGSSLGSAGLVTGVRSDVGAGLLSGLGKTVPGPGLGSGLVAGVGPGFGSDARSDFGAGVGAGLQTGLGQTRPGTSLRSVLGADVGAGGEAGLGVPLMQPYLPQVLALVDAMLASAGAPERGPRYDQSSGDIGATEGGKGGVGRMVPWGACHGDNIDDSDEGDRGGISGATVSLRQAGKDGDEGVIHETTSLTTPSAAVAAVAPVARAGGGGGDNFEEKLAVHALRLFGECARSGGGLHSGGSGGSDDGGFATGGGLMMGATAVNDVNCSEPSLEQAQRPSRGAQGWGGDGVGRETALRGHSVGASGVHGEGVGDDGRKTGGSVFGAGRVHDDGIVSLQGDDGLVPVGDAGSGSPLLDDGVISAGHRGVVALRAQGAVAAGHDGHSSSMVPDGSSLPLPDAGWSSWSQDGRIIHPLRDAWAVAAERILPRALAHATSPAIVSAALLAMATVPRAAFLGLRRDVRQWFLSAALEAGHAATLHAAVQARPDHPASSIAPSGGSVPYSVSSGSSSVPYSVLDGNGTAIRSGDSRSGCLIDSRLRAGDEQGSSRSANTGGNRGGDSNRNGNSGGGGSINCGAAGTGGAGSGAVLAAACRLLGVLVCPPFADMLDAETTRGVTSTLAKSLEQQRTLLVRMSAAWALANLCDTFSVLSHGLSTTHSASLSLKTTDALGACTSLSPGTTTAYASLVSHGSSPTPGGSHTHAERRDAYGQPHPEAIRPAAAAAAAAAAAGTEIAAATPGYVPAWSLSALASCAVRAAADNDKVRAHAVRALGNLAKFVDFGSFPRHHSSGSARVSHSRTPSDAQPPAQGAMNREEQPPPPGAASEKDTTRGQALASRGPPPGFGPVPSRTSPCPPEEQPAPLAPREDMVVRACGVVLHDSRASPRYSMASGRCQVSEPALPASSTASELTSGLSYCTRLAESKLGGGICRESRQGSAGGQVDNQGSDIGRDAGSEPAGASWLGDLLSVLHASLATGSPKVQWNACYAVACVLGNATLAAACHKHAGAGGRPDSQGVQGRPPGSQVDSDRSQGTGGGRQWPMPQDKGSIEKDDPGSVSSVWRWEHDPRQLLLPLADLLTRCDNFKIRIHAAGALCTPAQRGAYGPLFAPVTELVARAVVAEFSSEGGRHFGGGQEGLTQHVADRGRPAASQGNHGGTVATKGELGASEGSRHIRAQEGMTLLGPLGHEAAEGGTLSTGTGTEMRRSGANGSAGSEAERSETDRFTEEYAAPAGARHPDPTEYKYRPALRAALSSCLAHLLGLVCPDDDAEPLRGMLATAGLSLARDWLRPLVRAQVSAASEHAAGPTVSGNVIHDHMRGGRALGAHAGDGAEGWSYQSQLGHTGSGQLLHMAINTVAGDAEYGDAAASASGQPAVLSGRLVDGAGSLGVALAAMIRLSASLGMAELKAECRAMGSLLMGAGGSCVEHPSLTG